MVEIKTILVTTDFSETSVHAFSFARDLADKYGARVYVVYVEENHLHPLVIEYANIGYEEMARHQRKRANDQLARLVIEQLGDDPRFIPKVVEGRAHVEIVRLAQELDAGLIVMATHGGGFISHAILGSTTERVVRRASCPVLVVRDESAG